MNKKIRSDSDSESVKRGVHVLTTMPIVPSNRASTLANVNRGSIYYPAVSELSPNNRLITTSASILNNKWLTFLLLINFLS
jgi:hypothetical protein